MKTRKLAFQSAYSLVELLVAMLLIVLITTIAFPGIAGVIQNSKESADRRNAQSVASMSVAAIAAGATAAQIGMTTADVVSNLAAGVTVTNGTLVNGPFRVSGLPTTTTYYQYLSENGPPTGGVRFNP